MMNVAIALNRKVIVPAYVLLTSLFCNHPKDGIDVYVLHTELTTDDMKLFKELAEQYEKKAVKEMYVDRSGWQELPETYDWSIETYYRLMLPDMLPESITRILYLDVDMVVNRRIVSFYEMPFEDKLFICAEDFRFDEELEMCSKKRYDVFKALKDQGMKYFCAGMLLMNIDGLRKKVFVFKST